MKYLVIPRTIMVDGKHEAPVFYSNEMPPSEFVFESQEDAMDKAKCMRERQPDIDWTYIEETPRH